MTYNGKYLARLWSDSTYLVDTFRKNKYQYQNLQNDKVFGALNYEKSFLMQSEFNDNDKDFYSFTFKDSSVSMNILFVSKEIIYISKTSYLPMKQIYWSRFEGGVQYSKIEVKKIENLEHQSFKKIMKQSDSLIKAIRTYKSLDSIYALNKVVYNDLKVGDTLKNFMGYLHGTTDSLYFHQIKDSIVILDFSYTTCGPCSAAVPHLINLNNQYKQRGVKIMAVNPYSNDWPRLDKYMDFYKMNYQVLKINHSLVFDFGVHAYPTLFIIKNGIIKVIKIGYSETMEKEISKTLDSLL